MEPYAWRRVYTFCIRQPTSQYPVGSFLVIPKSQQYIATRKAELGGFLGKMNICKGVMVPFKIFLNFKNFFFFFFFFFLCVQPTRFFFAKRLNWFLIVLFSRRIIYQILVSYLQMFNNFGNLFRVAGKLGLVGYDGFYFHFFSYVH